MNDFGKFFISFLEKIYFMMNIASFILLIFLIRDKSIDSPCLTEAINNLEMSPIYDIYLTSEKTNESVRLGYLEEYSSNNIKIKSTEIYKWKNNYINVKRIKDEAGVKNIDSSSKYFNSYSESLNEICPIKYIGPTPDSTNSLTSYKILQFDDGTRLYFSNNCRASDWQLLFDLKVSFRWSYINNLKNNSDICFSHNCRVNEAHCDQNVILEPLDKDETYRFKYYNNISIDAKNNIDYFEADEYILHQIKNIYIDDYFKKNIKSFKKFYKIFLISIFLVNILLRFIKYILSFEISKPEKDFLSEKYCSNFNLLFPIIHAINGALFLALIIISQKSGFYYNYANELVKDIQIYLPVFEMTSLFFSLIMSYTFFNWYEKTRKLGLGGCFCCTCCDENIRSNRRRRKKIINQLKEIELESEPIRSEFTDKSFSSFCNNLASSSTSVLYFFSLLNFSGYKPKRI